MVVFPNCKINLGLRITGKRADGFHNLDTVFFPLPLRDVAEILPSEKQFDIVLSGIGVPGKNEDNLCYKAWLLLKKDFPRIPAAKMYLHKAIPAGAGLGGGSADGAFTLKALNELFELGLSTGQLIGYALQLGSDCPFFILNKPVHATGRGELMTGIHLDLSDYYFVLVLPAIHINTAQVFAQLTAHNNGRFSTTGPDTAAVVSSPVENWSGNLRNDFEPVVFNQYPELSKLKEKLYEAGAVYASMTGTGSTIFGIFRKAAEELSTGTDLENTLKKVSPSIKIYHLNSQL